MDFFEKFGGRQVFLRWDKTQGQPPYDKDFTIEELAKAIEDRVLERMAKPACEHKDATGRPYSERIVPMAHSITKPYRFCPLCGDKLE